MIWSACYGAYLLIYANATQHRAQHRHRERESGTYLPTYQVLLVGTCLPTLQLLPTYLPNVASCWLLYVFDVGKCFYSSSLLIPST